ncbi:hypothetical protein GH714_035144 [Hevea brasiliensis]|uniref:RNase H type-1 domain-containing protein n=1 Tax=Hevea brasiliensis TaxID=3981 RepID=A0A6A6K8A1_HEVBR|nr:hypothetical protein GH714_035144 [Hevea brasiliensis]
MGHRADKFNLYALRISTNQFFPLSFGRDRDELVCHYTKSSCSACFVDGLNSRNNFLFRQSCIPAYMLVSTATTLLEEFQEDNAKNSATQAAHCPRRWITPHPKFGKVKLNFDVALGGGGCCGYGMVLRNHVGEVLMSGAAHVSKDYKLTKLRLRLHVLGFTVHLKLVSDNDFGVGFSCASESFSQNMVAPPTHYFTRLHQLLIESDSCASFSCVHAYREANGDAYSLARLAFSLD